jgi:hypothetical protein
MINNMKYQIKTTITYYEFDEIDAEDLEDAHIKMQELEYGYRWQPVSGTPNEVKSDISLTDHKV